MKRIISLSLICTLLLMGCGSAQKHSAQTPEETINTAFAALKELDMATFNTYTNNKSEGCHLFGDLSRRPSDNAYYSLAEAVVEDLSWEIHEVQINEDTATVNVTIHNKDFSNTMGIFVTDLITKISNNIDENKSLKSLIHDSTKEAIRSPEVLLPYLQNCEDSFAVEVSIVLEKTNDIWVIQLNDSLCNNLTGNLGSNNFSKDVAEKISAAEELLTRNIERWSITFEKNINQQINE